MVDLKKENQVAILFSNEALSAFNWFRFGWGSTEGYNDVLRPFYDALYNMNIGVDFVDPSSKNMEEYDLLIVPTLYAAPDSLLQRLNAYVKNGGHILYTFKSGFSDSRVKVRTSDQPGIINQACGITYSQFVLPEKVTLKDVAYQHIDPAKVQVKYWMELITPVTAKVLAHYDHPVWGKYAAITQNKFGKGLATYVGFMPGKTLLSAIIKDVVQKADIKSSNLIFPLITKSGTNQAGKKIHYFFNYSPQAQDFTYEYPSGTELLNEKEISLNTKVTLKPWGIKIIEEK